MYELDKEESEICCECAFHICTIYVYIKGCKVTDILINFQIRAFSIRVLPLDLHCFNCRFRKSNMNIEKSNIILCCCVLLFNLYLYLKQVNQRKKVNYCPS
jgi:hypothetical protein